MGILHGHRARARERLGPSLSRSPKPPVRCVSDTCQVHVRCQMRVTLVITVALSQMHVRCVTRCMSDVWPAHVRYMSDACQMHVALMITLARLGFIILDPDATPTPTPTPNPNPNPSCSSSRSPTPGRSGKSETRHYTQFQWQLWLVSVRGRTIAVSTKYQ